MKKYDNPRLNYNKSIESYKYPQIKRKISRQNTYKNSMKKDEEIRQSKVKL